MRPLCLFLLVSAVFFCTPTFSQQVVCGFDHLNQHLRKNADYIQKVASTEIKIQQNVDNIIRNRARFQNLNILPGPAYEIPVVVHVITPSGNPVGWVNPSDQQIRDAIDRLSADFAATSARNVGASTPIKFTLAKRTQNCSPTDGIVRVDGNSVAGYTTNGVVLPGSPDEVVGADNEAIRGLSFWPNNLVYNIWVVWKIAADVTSGTYVGGYANLPTEDPDYPYYPIFLREGMMILASELIAPNSTTLTHELGHAFGLYHTFEGGTQTVCPPITDATNCSTVGDKVCDTDPVRNLLQGGACAINNADANPCYNSLPYNNIQKNIMGYGGCLDRFTAGQSARMLAALNVARAGLMSSVASTPPPLTAVKANTTQVPGNNSVGTITAMGPWNVTLANLTYQSYGYVDDNQQFYQDNSCNFGTALSATTSPTLTVTTGGNNRQTCKAWIDFNNNGVFDSDELIMNSSTPVGTGGVFSHTTQISSSKLASSETARNQLLRMRVRADLITNPNFGPGGALQYGQTEDFWVSIDGALPVVFGGLTAKINNDQLFVDWKTESETNNDHFFVEASFDGAYFARIAKIDSKAINGSSASSLQYNISIDSKGAVLSLGAFLAAALSLFSFRQNRKWMLLTAVIAGGIFIACQKRDNGVSNSGNHVKFIRIAQVDKDGTIQFSRVVSVISE